MHLQDLLNLSPDKKILILGFGIENQQFFKWLTSVANFSSKRIIIADKKPLKSELDISESTIIQGENYLQSLEIENVEYVFKAPGIWSLLPQIEAFREKRGPDSVHSSLVFFWQKFREQIVAITGTKGKSTTSSLVAHILNNFTPQPSSKKIQQANYCGNTVGISPYTFWTKLDQITNPDIFFVVETSSFQLQDLDYTKISPKYGIITNYYIDHLDQHSNKEEYWGCKDSLFLYQSANDTLVTSTQVTQVSPHKDILNQKLIVTSNQIGLVETQFHSKLVGQHNYTNIAQAITLVESLYLQRDDQKAHDIGNIWLSILKQKDNYNSALETFTPLAHRLEKFATGEYIIDIEGQNVSVKIDFIDDGYATEPDAVAAAINSCGEQRDTFLWLQLCGVDKGGEFANLCNSLKNIYSQKRLLRVDYCGQVGKNIALQTEAVGTIDKSLVGQNFHSLWESLANKEFFLRSLQQQIISNQITGKEIKIWMVLSPSGSSFDEFENYTIRANWWREKCLNLI